jgi:hypothetical protein
MNISKVHYYFHELVLPTILFMVLGGMTWAVRGCSGFGGSNGCLFAGITLATAWWFLSYDPKQQSIRPYANALAVMAMTIGIAFSGSRGWMQWPAFFEGKLYTNYTANEFVPIQDIMDIMAVYFWIPWAGLGACFLAWSTVKGQTTRQIGLKDCMSCGGGFFCCNIV